MVVSEFLSGSQASVGQHWSVRSGNIDSEPGMTADIVPFEFEGLAKGRAEGRAEGLTEVAKQMLADGMPADKIATYTKLSIEEIKSLQV